MAKHFRLQRRTASCEAVLKRSQYADYSVGTVCKTADGWTYRAPDGPAMPAATKRAAIKGLLIARKRWIGNRSALEGARASTSCCRALRQLQKLADIGELNHHTVTKAVRAGCKAR